MTALSAGRVRHATRLPRRPLNKSLVLGFSCAMLLAVGLCTRSTATTSTHGETLHAQVLI